MTSRYGSETKTRHRRRALLFKDVARVVLVGLFFLGVAVLLKYGFLREHFLNISELRATLKGSGIPGGHAASAGLFMLAGGAFISFGVPRLWISAVAGAIYGALLGSVLSVGAAVMGAGVVYLVGRSLLGSVVRRRVGGRLDVWRRRFRQDAFWWVLYGRLFPFSNATMHSLLCGSCRVSFMPYLAGSVLGFVPLAVVFATFGSGGIKGNFYQIALGFCLIGVTFMAQTLLRKGRPKGAERKQGPSDADRIASE